MLPTPPQGTKWDGGRRTDAAAAGVPTTADTAYAYLKQTVNLLLSLEGDVQAHPDATRQVELLNIFEPGVTFYDPSGGLIGTADITPGTHDVYRIRIATETKIVDDVASSEAAGRVYVAYTVDNTNWAIGDLGYALFKGIVIWTGTSSETSMPDIPVFFRVVRTGSIQTTVETIDDNTEHLYALIDGGSNAYPDSVVQESVIAYLMSKSSDPINTSYDNTTDSLEAISDLVTDTHAVRGTVSDVGAAATDFDTDLSEGTDNHYNGMLLMFLDGVCAGQAHLIDDYATANGNCTFVTSDQWTEAPGNGDAFIIIPDSGAYLKKIFTIADTVNTSVGTNGDAAGTTTVFARLKQIVDTYLGNGTIGLAVIEGYVDDIESRLGTPATGTVAGDVESIETKVGTNADGVGTTTVFARLAQIVTTYLSDGTIGLAAIEALVDDLESRLTAQRALNLDWLDISVFSQETAGAADSNGTSWVDLLDKSTITKPTKICGFKLTKAGTWAGDCRVRITDGSATKIFPFADYYTEGTEFNSGVQHTLNFTVNVPVADGYKIQFCSSNGGDGVGETLALTNLAIIEVG